MRFYYIATYIISLNLCLLSQLSGVGNISPNQIESIRSQGSTAIRNIFTENNGQIQNLDQIETYTSEIATALINDSATARTIANLAAENVIAMAEIAFQNDLEISHAVEYAAAGFAHGIVEASRNIKFDSYKAIEAGANGFISGAFDYENVNVNLDAMICAVASGYAAGAIEASNSDGLGVLNSIKLASSGLIYATVLSATSQDIDIHKSVYHASAGIAEAAVEASVKLNLELIPQIKTAAAGAAEKAVIASAETGINVKDTLTAVSAGFAQGAFQAIPGNGINVRILIDPIEGIDPISVQKAIAASIESKTSIFTLPIIETPYMDDASLRSVSPVL